MFEGPRTTIQYKQKPPGYMSQDIGMGKGKEIQWLLGQEPSEAKRMPSDLDYTSGHLERF